MSFYSGAKKALAGFVRFLFGISVEGAENEPADVTCLICANHISEADPVMLGASLKHNPRYMAKKELMRIPVLKQLITALGAFPIDRGGSDVGAIKRTVEMLKNGESVIMFPQGTRCRGVDPETTKVKHGCALIALRADVPVLPILIRTRRYKVRLFQRTVIRIGTPIDPQELKAAAGDRDDYKAGAELIFSRILKLNRPEE